MLPYARGRRFLQRLLAAALFAAPPLRAAAFVTVFIVALFITDAPLNTFPMMLHYDIRLRLGFQLLFSASAILRFISLLITLRRDFSISFQDWMQPESYATSRRH